MDWKRPGSQLRASCTGDPALSVLACLLLLAGCANPPKEARRSREAAALGTESSGNQVTVSSKAVGPAEGKKTSAAAGEPIMTFEKNVHDFGEIGPLGKNVCEFRFKNTGTGVLKVRDKIDTTCGCTVAALSETEYAPGQEGVIRVTYAGGGYAGSVTKSLTVYSNDKSNGGKATLTIKATAVERVVYGPKYLELRLKGPDAGCPPVTVRSLDGRSFAVTRILASGGSLSAGFDPSLEATEFTFRPTVDAEQLQKNPTGTLLLALTHPECSEVHIPYQAVPEFQLTPHTLILFNVEPNRPLLRDVWLSNSYGEEFEVASCTSAAHMVTVLEKEKVVSEDGKSVRYHLRLSIQPPFLVGEKRVFEDTLTIHLANDKAVPLPCRVFYRGPRVPVAGVNVRNR